MLEPLLSAALACPGFVVLGVPGILLVVLGAGPAAPVFRQAGAVLSAGKRTSFTRRMPNVLPFQALHPSRGRPSRCPAGATEMPVGDKHFVNGQSLKGPYPEGAETIYFGLGCFWGAERLFWELPGVIVTAVGYQGGNTPNPTYDEVCSGPHRPHRGGQGGVRPQEGVARDAAEEASGRSTTPTQGMRQGNDYGTQYRSAIYTTSPEQAAAVEASRKMYQDALSARGKGTITTEITPAKSFFYAETYHQQYLAKNPNGYCGCRGPGFPARSASPRRTRRPEPAGADAGTGGAVPRLFERAGFEAFVLGLPAATLVRQWGDASVGKVGGKIFAIFGGGISGDAAVLSFKCFRARFRHAARPAGHPAGALPGGGRNGWRLPPARR